MPLVLAALTLTRSRPGVARVRARRAASASSTRSTSRRARRSSSRWSGREDLINAIALNSSMVNGARVVGPAVAGLLVAAVGEGWCFLAERRQLPRGDRRAADDGRAAAPSRAADGARRSATPSTGFRFVARNARRSARCCCCSAWSASPGMPVRRADADLRRLDPARRRARRSGC